MLRCGCTCADIQPGQGLYRTEVAGRRTFLAKNCDENSYGVTQVAYGRTPFPCRECPANMVTSSDAATFPNSASYFVDNKDGTRGFVDPKACVTKAGFGYSSRSAEACPKGWYNGQDTLDICKLCPYGTTTAGVGVGVTVADCKLAPGFGFHSNQILACPVGEWRAYNQTFGAGCVGCQQWFWPETRCSERPLSVCLAPHTATA